MKVIKRDGREVEYDWGKIESAIGKAYAAIGKDFKNPDINMVTCLNDLEVVMHDIAWPPQKHNLEERPFL